MQTNGICFLLKCSLVLRAKLLCKQYGNNICLCYKRAMKGREKLHSFCPSYKTTEVSSLQRKFLLTPSTVNESLGSRINNMFLTNVWINALNVFVWIAYDMIRYSIRK